MENNIFLLTKEQYSLRKTASEIAITNRVLANIIDKKPKEYFEKGEYYFDRNEFQEAIKWYSLAITENTHFSNAYCKRAYSKLNLQQYHDAIVDFDKAIQINPQYNDAYFGRGNTKGMGFRDFEGAISDFLKAIELEPKDAYAYFFLSKSKEYSGNIKGAVEDLLKAGQLGAKEAAEQVSQVLGKINDTNYEEYCSIERLSIRIDQDRNNADLYFRRAMLKAKLSDFVNAISDFSVAISLDKSKSDYYFYRAATKADGNDSQGAILDYTKVIEMDPENAAAYYNRARRRSDLKDYNGALSDYKQRIQLKKADKYVFYNTGRCLFNLGNVKFNSQKLASAEQAYNESIEYFTKAIELDETFASPFGNRGAAKRMLAYLNHGITKGKKGEKDGACADFQKAYELGDEEALGLMNEYCSESVIVEADNNIEDCIVFLEKADTHYKKNEHETAIYWCNKALEIDKNNAKAYYGIV